MSHFAYIAHLPNVDLSTPLLQISVDTLCLAEIGSLYQDERLLNESRSRYVRALPMLANELARPKARQLRKDHVLAAITVLALCELFDAIAQGNHNGQGWISHVNGAQQYIKSHGSDVIETEFGRLLFHNVRHSSMCMGLVQRKAAVFASPQWLDVTRVLARTDPYVALYDIVLQVPGILERADRLLQTRNFSEDFSRICLDICSLRSELDDWMKLWYSSTDRGSFSIVDVRTMKEFSTLCFERLFQTVYSFASVQVCSQHQLYWISCMLLDYTLLNIYRTHGGHYELSPITDFISTRTPTDIERELFVAAASYCRSIPYSCEPEVASIGRIGTFLLRITQSYFEQCGHCNELEWCRGVRRMLESGGHAEHSPSSTESNDTTGGDTRPHGPWNVKHQCKSPRCNFLVQCCAPAPQLLEGEYGYAEYAPHQPTQQLEPLRRYGASHDSSHSPQDLNLTAHTKPAYPLHSKEPVRIEDALRAHGLRSLKKRPMICCITAPNTRSNGTSALANEGVCDTLGERTVLPHIQPTIGPKGVPFMVTLQQPALTPNVEGVRTSNLTGRRR